MEYYIYFNGDLINTIISEESFVRTYCEKRGYTFAAVNPIPEPEPEPTLEDRVASIESAIERGLSL